MKRILSLFFVLSLIFPLGVQAQNPEMEKAQFWVGDWSYEVGEGYGTMSFKSHGDLLIYAIEDYTNPSGALIRYVHVMGYDSEEGVYWWRRFTRSSSGGFFKGTLDGNTWTWLTEVVEGRQTRMVQVAESEDVIQFRWERSIDGGPWEVTSQGTTRRVK